MCLMRAKGELRKSRRDPHDLLVTRTEKDIYCNLSVSRTGMLEQKVAHRQSLSLESSLPSRDPVSFFQSSAHNSMQTGPIAGKVRRERKDSLLFSSLSGSL